MRGIDVKEKLKKGGFALKSVADLMGETPQNLNSMLNAQDVKTGVVEKIANAINKSLYFFYSDNIEIELNKKVLEPINPTNSTEGIPLIPLHAMAGYMSGEVQVLEFEAERYIIPMFKDAEFLIPVKGSSMHPKYNSGDIVACKKLSLSDIFFQWNKVYVLDTDQGVIVKRIRKGTNDNSVNIVSDNPAYEPFELSLNKIHSIAIVIGVIRLE